MQPASGKEKAKVGRRRIACTACSTNKQKCDGATRHPCRRCELYNVACEYPDGKVPRSAVRVHPVDPSDDPSPATGQGRATTTTTTTVTPTAAATARGTGRGAVTRSAASSPAGMPHPDAEGSDTATLLREIRERLFAIEAGLDQDRRQGGLRPNPAAAAAAAAPTSATTTFSLPTPSPRNPDHRPLAPPSTANSDSASHALEQMDMPGESNPLQVLVATLDEVERLNRRDQAMDEDRESDERGSSGLEPNASRKGHEARMDELSEEEQLIFQARRTPRSNRPDVFSRGLMSIEDVELAYAFYRQRVQPWIPVVEDRSPLLVRAKSPFLFHAILVVTDYYNTSTSPRAAEVYTGLTAIVNELVASVIFAPDPSLFNSDLVRGLLLLLYYKPIQTTFHHNRGVKTKSRVAHASKVNALSSLMIHSLLQRTASFLNLQQSPVLLYMYFDNPEAAAKEKIPPYEVVLDDYRLWCSLIAVDNLGSLQSGRASWADPTSALRVGRKFASLEGHATDVRRTAILELYSIIAVPPSAAAATRPVRYRLERLPQINAELERWRAHWKPLLDAAQLKGDPLAYTVERTLACFVSLSVNGATFSRWSLERQKEIELGKEGRPTLTTEDWTQLQVAADAAQSAIYAVSLEAQDGFKPLKGGDWPRVNGSQREPLRMSLAVAEDFKTALDTITCIAFAYSLLFLVRMSSAGLISCNIVARQSEYESGANLGVQPLTSGDKLPLLLELGSKFLHAIAPSIDHPAESHAVLIQTILKVGSSAAAASASAGSAGSPFSPSLATTTPSAPFARSYNDGGTHPSYALSTTSTAATTAFSNLSRGSQSRPSAAAAGASEPSWPWDDHTRNGAPGAARSDPEEDDGDAASSSLSGRAATGPAAAMPTSIKSISIPNLLDSSVLPALDSSSFSTTTNTLDRIGTAAPATGGGGADEDDQDPAQAMASLLASSNPFLGEFYATQPTLLNSSVFNHDDFGLSGIGGPAGAIIGGVGDGSDWASFGDLGNLAAGSSWMGL
ncbi:hypothetical protein JCM11491_005613 [Sporobolomyces phaffii]